VILKPGSGEALTSTGEYHGPDPWEQNVDRSRAALEQVLRSDALGRVVQRPPPNVEPATVRWVLCHMIEEYARHNGHADLLREFVDGQTGESANERQVFGYVRT
jgi:hypothetical protein